MLIVFNSFILRTYGLDVLFAPVYFRFSSLPGTSSTIVWWFSFYLYKFLFSHVLKFDLTIVESILYNLATLGVAKNKKKFVTTKWWIYLKSGWSCVAGGRGE